MICNSHDLNLVNSTSDRRLVLHRPRPNLVHRKHADEKTALYPLLDFDPRRDQYVGRRYLQGMHGGIPIARDAEFTIRFRAGRARVRDR